MSGGDESAHDPRKDECATKAARLQNVTFAERSVRNNKSLQTTKRLQFRDDFQTLVEVALAFP
jgi:hypothetical protein